jgi:hypothetical protein
LVFKNSPKPVIYIIKSMGRPSRPIPPSPLRKEPWKQRETRPRGPLSQFNGHSVAIQVQTRPQRPRKNPPNTKRTPKTPPNDNSFNRGEGAHPPRPGKPLSYATTHKHRPPETNPPPTGYKTTNRNQRTSPAQPSRTLIDHDGAEPEITLR